MTIDHFETQYNSVYLNLSYAFKNLANGSVLVDARITNNDSFNLLKEIVRKLWFQNLNFQIFTWKFNFLLIKMTFKSSISKSWRSQPPLDDIETGTVNILSKCSKQHCNFVITWTKRLSVVDSSNNSRTADKNIVRRTKIQMPQTNG